MSSVPAADTPENLALAVRLLASGQLVAFPTETVYGLGADARNAKALERLFQAKGRPQNHPVIVHIHRLDELQEWACEITETAQILAKHFWPGPLTLVLKKRSGVLDAITGGQDTIGIRMPSHQTAIKLLTSFGSGLAAPSANKFGKLSPTSAQHVVADLGDSVSMILDGGQCSVGIESTILDATHRRPRILRPGMITASTLEQVFEFEPNSIDTAIVSTPKSELANHSLPNDPSSKGSAPPLAVLSADDSPRVPGSLESHYAPRALLQIVPSSEIMVVLKQHSDQRVAVLAFRPAPQEADSCLDWVVAPSNPDQFAQILYAALRQLDQSGSDLILVERLPDHSDWLAIVDRLNRAAAPRQTR